MPKSLRAGSKKALAEMERVLKKKDVAAFIMEPIVCNLTVQIPEMSFMSEAQKICRKYGTLFIVDEVATGFGRTGKLFASENYGSEIAAKALKKGLDLLEKAL